MVLLIYYFLVFNSSRGGTLESNQEWVNGVQKIVATKVGSVEEYGSGSASGMEGAFEETFPSLFSLASFTKA